MAGPGGMLLMRTGLRAALVLGTLAGFGARGCAPGARTQVRERRPAPGIAVRRIQQGLCSLRILDADLSDPHVRIEIAAAEIAVRDGLITGRARTLPEWLQATGAAAGVNGGFFGETLTSRNGAGEFKEIVGLLKQSGRVRVAAPRYTSRPSGTRYARSAFGVTERGDPALSWVTSARGRPQELWAHAQPMLTGTGARWQVREALGCGPRIVHRGEIDLQYRAERLASPGALPRTFVGFGGPAGKPAHVVLCAASGMEFEDAARFLVEYFRRQYGATCSEGMCLDGGASTQLAWREGGAVRCDPDPGTSVPTAILVYRR